MQTDVIIIGAGIAGLACGVELSRSGLRVTVLESASEPGGRARSWADPLTGDVVDIGPHILLSEYHNMLSLLEELGTRDQLVWQDDKFITLVDRPHPVEVRMHKLPAPLHFLPSLMKMPQVSRRDLLSNRKLLWQVVHLNKADKARLDAVSAEEHLRKLGVSERFIDWFWRSACMTIMNVPLQRCSAAALLNFFRFMIGKSGYQVGFAGCGLGELFVPGAVQRIESAGGQVLTGAEVTQVVAGEGGTLTVQLLDGRQCSAHHLIAALPPQSLRPLLPDSWVSEHAVFADLDKFKPSPYLSTYIWFERKLTDQRFWTRVWSPVNLNYDFYDLSNIRSGWQERPSVIASNIIYSRRAASMTDDEIITATVRELADYLPEAAHTRIHHASVHRIPMAVPAPLVGTEQLRPGPGTPIPGLLLAGDWTRTGLPASMEGAVRSGFIAAEKVLEARGQPRAIAKPLPEAEGWVRWLGGP